MTRAGAERALRRAAALGLLAATLGAAGALAAWPMAEAARAETRAAALTREIAALEERVARRAALDAERARLVRLREDRADYLAGPTPALAAAELQRLLSQLAERQGWRVDSVQVQSITPERPFTRITLRLQIRMDVASLRNFIWAIENGRPRLLVEALSVRSRGTARPTAEPPREPLVLVVSLDLSGFLVAPDAP